MVQLVDSDIKTREVLGWKGVHVLHFMGSSCSQKLRVFLNLKKIPWHSHPIDLPNNENMQPWFLGINPRGLVPVLVHDGAVHIESNDIINISKEISAAKAHSGRPRERSRKAAQARRRSASRPADAQLPLRVRAARTAEIGRRARKLRRQRRRHRAGRQGTEKQIQIEFWKRAAKEGFTDGGRARPRKDFAPNSMNSTGHWQSSLTFWAKP